MLSLYLCLQSAGFLGKITGNTGRCFRDRSGGFGGVERVTCPLGLRCISVRSKLRWKPPALTSSLQPVVAFPRWDCGMISVDTDRNIVIILNSVFFFHTFCNNYIFMRAFLSATVSLKTNFVSQLLTVSFGALCEHFISPNVRTDLVISQRFLWFVFLYWLFSLIWNEQGSVAEMRKEFSNIEIKIWCQLWGCLLFSWIFQPAITYYFVTWGQWTKSKHNT